MPASAAEIKELSDLLVIARDEPKKLTNGDTCKLLEKIQDHAILQAMDIEPTEFEKEIALAQSTQSEIVHFEEDEPVNPETLKTIILSRIIAPLKLYQKAKLRVPEKAQTDTEKRTEIEEMNYQDIILSIERRFTKTPLTELWVDEGSASGYERLCQRRYKFAKDNNETSHSSATEHELMVASLHLALIYKYQSRHFSIDTTKNEQTERYQEMMARYFGEANEIHAVLSRKCTQDNLQIGFYLTDYERLSTIYSSLDEFDASIGRVDANKKEAHEAFYNRGYLTHLLEQYRAASSAVPEASLALAKGYFQLARGLKDKEKDKALKHISEAESILNEALKKIQFSDNLVLSQRIMNLLSAVQQEKRKLESVGGSAEVKNVAEKAGLAPSYQPILTMQKLHHQITSGSQEESILTFIATCPENSNLDPEEVYHNMLNAGLEASKAFSSSFTNESLVGEGAKYQDNRPRRYHILKKQPNREAEPYFKLEPDNSVNKAALGLVFKKQPLLDEQGKQDTESVGLVALTIWSVLHQNKTAESTLNIVDTCDAAHILYALTQKEYVSDEDREHVYRRLKVDNLEQLIDTCSDPETSKAAKIDEESREHILNALKDIKQAQALGLQATTHSATEGVEVTTQDTNSERICLKGKRSS